MYMYMHMYMYMYMCTCRVGQCLRVAAAQDGEGGRTGTGRYVAMATQFPAGHVGFASPVSECVCVLAP